MDSDASPPTRGGTGPWADYLGRRVHLSRDVVKHIQQRHPEAGPFLHRIPEVLVAPNFVYFRPRVNSYLFYKLGVLSGRLTNAYLTVIVCYNDEGEGRIKTVYPTTRPAGTDALVYVGGRS